MIQSQKLKINAAAPDGAPPRRISNQMSEKTFAPPCLGEALRRGTLSKSIFSGKIALKCSGRLTPALFTPCDGNYGPSFATKK